MTLANRRHRPGDVRGWLSLAVILLLSGVAPADDSPEYRRVVEGRAAKIVAKLGLADVAQQSRVLTLIADQYQGLSNVHDQRDAQLADAEGSSDEAKAVIRDASSHEVVTLHRHFVAALTAELSAEQVGQVKDGMTYGVVPITYAGYLRLLPDLSDDLKRMIHANLLEAREYAMDAGSSHDKHGWFGKYKGRINNRLSAAGYDLKQAEQELAARKAG